MTYLDREIRAQPAVLERFLKKESKRVARIAEEIHKEDVRTVFLVARGSSDNAGLYGKYLLGARNRLVVALATPSLFTLYKRPPDVSKCLVIAISQSGASDDLCEVVRQSKFQGAKTLVITNRADSQLAKQADHRISLHAGAEKSVAATKTFTAELMALTLLSVSLDGKKSDRDALLRVPEMVAKVLEDDQRIADLAQRYRYVQHLAVIGRGYNYSIAFELSLKLKELAYVTAEPSSSADFRHGPIAVVNDGFPVLLVAPKGCTLADMQDLTRALESRGAEIIAISNSRQILKSARTTLPIPSSIPEWLSPLVTVVPGQLLARHLAAARGCPLDRPRGLSKVTRTL